MRPVMLALLCVVGCDAALAPASVPGGGAPENATAAGTVPVGVPGAASASGAGAGAASALQPKPPRRPGAYANDDPDDDLVVGPPDVLPDCEERLARAGIRYRSASLPVHEEHRSKILCGAPQVVIYSRGPGNIAYDPPPMLTCTMALALASFEGILQDEAARTFHSPVVRVEQLGTYSCRQIAAYPGWISEHSYANAIDLARFTLRSGVTLEVQRDFDLGEGEPKRPGGAFLRAVSRRAFDEDVFSHVLTPFFNAAHRNHFHLDLARYRGDGTRPESS